MANRTFRGQTRERPVSAGTTRPLLGKWVRWSDVQGLWGQVIQVKKRAGHWYALIHIGHMEVNWFWGTCWVRTNRLMEMKPEEVVVAKLLAGGADV